MIERLKNPEIVERIARELEEHGIMEERYIEWPQIVISGRPHIRRSREEV